MHSDNYQALRLLQARYRETCKCVYIDPPYNTDSSSIPYKNNYRHSSFATLIRDRAEASWQLLGSDGAIFVSIDKTERTVVEHALDDVFGPGNHIEELIWTQATANSQLPNYSTNHEYVEVYARDRSAVEADKQMFREPKPGFLEVMDLVARLNPEYPPSQEVEAALKKLYREHKREYRRMVEAGGRVWDADSKRNDPWRGLYQYNRAEYRTVDGAFVPEEEAKAHEAQLWVWREMPAGAPASKQSATTKDPDHLNYRFYKPNHPNTGKPCPHPQTGWKFPRRPDSDRPGRRSFESLEADKRIAWGDDETKIPQTKGFLHEVETNIGTSVFYEYNVGEAELGDMFGESGLFLSPKSSRFVKRFVFQASKADDWILDYFAGTGSSGHAVIQSNREDGRKRKFVLVEIGHYFDELTKPRVLKAAYASDWKSGKPRSRDGVSALIKVVRLESYEDALNNLHLDRSDAQRMLLSDQEASQPGGFAEAYALHYMLSVETQASQSLLNVSSFSDPTAYKLSVKSPLGDESREVNVDLVETFNYLIGLRVQHVDAPQAFTASFKRNDEGRLCVEGRLKLVDDGAYWFRTITGMTPDGKRALIIWRKRPGGDDPEGIEQDNAVLDAWFRTQGYSTTDSEFDLVWVNGDNNLANLRQEEASEEGLGETGWKVRVIEQDFHELMFDTSDVPGGA